MQVEVTVPELGESISEVEVSGWLKQPGEMVALDEPLIELETDKATVEVESPASGVVLQHIVDQGSIVPVNAPIAIALWFSGRCACGASASTKKVE